MARIGLSDSEFKIMLLIWEKPVSMPQILAEIGEETGWSKHVVLTFISRMIKKGAIEPIETKPARTYRPLVSREEVVREETRGFLERVYQGNAGLLISHLVKDEALSPEEMDELMQTLNDMRRKT